MPDGVLLDASGKYLDYGLLGLTCFFLMLALAWVVRQWQAEQKSHQATRDARISDLKEHNADRMAIREAMTANTAAMNAVLDAVKERR